MRPVVLTVVHPETYFFDWEGKDKIWFDLHYGQRALRDLKVLSDQAIAHERPLICVREMLLGQAASPFGLGLLHKVTNYNLDSSGLVVLTPREPPYPRFREYWTLNGGVPLAMEARVVEGIQSLIDICPALLFQDSYRQAFSPYGNATHLIAGGVFSRCVVNWGNVLKKTFSDVDLCYIDELCVVGHAEEKDEALVLVPSTGGRVISFDEALTLL